MGCITYMEIPIRQPGAVLVHSRCSRTPPSRLPKGRQRKGELNKKYPAYVIDTQIQGVQRAGHVLTFTKHSGRNATQQALKRELKRTSLILWLKSAFKHSTSLRMRSGDRGQLWVGMGVALLNCSFRDSSNKERKSLDLAKLPTLEAPSSTAWC